MRLRAALLMPAIAAFGLGTAPLVTAAISAAPASSAVGSCIIDPINGGCMSVPCPKPLNCIENTGTTAAPAANRAVAACIVNPFNDGGCLPTPCPQKPVPFTCIESTGTTAVAAKA